MEKPTLIINIIRPIIAALTGSLRRQDTCDTKRCIFEEKGLNEV